MELKEQIQQQLLNYLGQVTTACYDRSNETLQTIDPSDEDAVRALLSSVNQFAGYLMGLTAIPMPKEEVNG